MAGTICLKWWLCPIQHSPRYSRWASIMKAWCPMSSGTLWGYFCEMMATCKPKAWTQSITLVTSFILGLEALLWLSFRVYAANLLYSTSFISINFHSSILFTNLLETGGTQSPNSKFDISIHGGCGWSSSRLSTLVGGGTIIGTWARSLLFPTMLDSG